VAHLLLFHANQPRETGLFTPYPVH